MPTAQRRTLVLQEIAQCLGGLVEARNAEECANTLSVFLLRLPLVWHSVDLFSKDRVERRLCSFRCSRGFVPFVTRLGFLKRQDGVYHGTFADATLVLIKVSHEPDGGLICGVGLEKHSPLNDGAVTACVGALIHEALSRLVAFDLRDRRAQLLDSVVGQNPAIVALIDADGQIVDRHPSTGEIPAEIVKAVAADRRRRGPRAATVAADGRVYAVQARWVTSMRPFQIRYQVLAAAVQSATPPPVREQLQSYGLSKRESEVAELVFTGTPNRRIAETLFISPDTVKTHCRRIFGKLGISRRTEFLRLMGGVPDASAPPPARMKSTA